MLASRSSASAFRCSLHHVSRENILSHQIYAPLPARVKHLFVAGTSTHKVGEVAQTLMGVAPSASAVSRLNHTLTEQFEAWRERSLLPHYRILYLDGIHFTVRHGEKTDSTIICLGALSHHAAPALCGV